MIKYIFWKRCCFRELTANHAITCYCLSPARQHFMLELPLDVVYQGLFISINFNQYFQIYYSLLYLYKLFDTVWRVLLLIYYQMYVFHRLGFFRFISLLSSRLIFFTNFTFKSSNTYFFCYCYITTQFLHRHQSPNR